MPIINQITKGGGTTPTGSVTITNNGTYDVTDKATAVVNVPTTAPAYYIEKAVDANGKLIGGSTVMNFNGVRDVGDYMLYGAFQYNNSITGVIDMSDLQTLTGNVCCYSMFSNAPNITDVDISSLTGVTGSEALRYAFSNSGITSLDLRNLQTVTGSQYTPSLGSICTNAKRLTSVDLRSISDLGYFSDAFNGCTNLTNVNLDSATNITASCENMFLQCSNLTNPNLLSKIQTIKGSAYGIFGGSGLTGVLDLGNLYVVTNSLGMAFNQCNGLTGVNIQKLSYLTAKVNQMFGYCAGLTTLIWDSLKKVTASQAFNYTFVNCASLTSLSFPALTSTSFGSYTNQFNRMLDAVTGCTVHFPSNLQSVIGSWADVIAGFGGTNTTVLFDLPSTVILTGENTTEYERSPKDDTATALAWRVKDTGTDTNPVIDWTPFYTSGTSDPAVNDTIYSDAACTTAVTTISSIA